LTRTIDGVVFDLKELAAATGVKYSTLWYRVYGSRSIPEPTVQVGRRHMYTVADFERLVSRFRAESDTAICGLKPAQ
jgi:hypothetical protein